VVAVTEFVVLYRATGASEVFVSITDP